MFYLRLMLPTQSPLHTDAKYAKHYSVILCNECQDVNTLI
jgi:hypothetical protein